MWFDAGKHEVEIAISILRNLGDGYALLSEVWAD
jgi:hypothetical protein